MSYYRDPTASAAIGAAERELRLAYKIARRLLRMEKAGCLTRQELVKGWGECPAAFRRNLRRALETGRVPEAGDGKAPDREGPVS